MDERDGNPEATTDVRVIKDSLHAPIVFVLKQVDLSISIQNPILILQISQDNNNSKIQKFCINYKYSVKLGAPWGMPYYRILLLLWTNLSPNIYSITPFHLLNNSFQIFAIFRYIKIRPKIGVLEEWQYHRILIHSCFGQTSPHHLIFENWCVQTL